jgi:membrane fusion protein, multidrug efflux system
MTPIRFGFFLLIVIGLPGCNDNTAALPPPRPVLTITVTPITTETFGPFTGTVEPRYQTQLGFQTSGRMVARDVYVGDLVKKGQRLAALDPTIPQFALTRAKADVADADAQLVNAEGNAARQTALSASGSSTQAALDSAVAGRDTAKARLDQAKAALRVAQEQIGYTELHANFDGVVTAWSAEVGQFVGDGQAVVTIARPDIREAAVDIPDELINQVTPGMVFNVRLEASPRIIAKARVREIDPLADPVTRSHRVLLTLEDPDPAFRLGTTITVAVERAIPPKILVPAVAVLGGGDGQYVWVLAADGRSVTPRTIGAAGTQNDMVIVGSGLSAGDKVVVVGVHSLHAGQAVAGEAAGSVQAKGTQL